jgi:hypothetical protein
MTAEASSGTAKVKEATATLAALQRRRLGGVCVSFVSGCVTRSGECASENGEAWWSTHQGRAIAEHDQQWLSLVLTLTLLRTLATALSTNAHFNICVISNNIQNWLLVSPHVSGFNCHDGR